MLLTPPACSKPNLSPIYILQQQLNLVKWQEKYKHKNKDWVLDTKSELGIVSIYITPTSSLKRTGTNLRICHPIPLGVLKMLDKSQKYFNYIILKLPRLIVR